MRILLLTQLFQPEPNHLKGLAFAKELVRQGHEVEVLTCLPNYPAGRLYDGYRMRLKTFEMMENIPVIRLALFVDHSASGLKRFICYMSFAAVASLLGPYLIRRPDVIHVYQGPATLCLPAMFFRSLFGVPYVLDIQDIWPDSVTASRMLTFPGCMDILGSWCNLTYRLASKIVVLSEGYKTRLLKRGVPADKIHVIYNWCNENEMLSATDDPGEAVDFGAADKFNIVFAGNMGKVQGLDTVLMAASKLSSEIPHARFVLIGDGVELGHLKMLASRLALTNVIFIPRQPARRIGQMLSAADALLIHLNDDPLSHIGIPQKTQAYMAVGRPIIMAVNGDSADMVRRAKSGIICEPGNPEAIANSVKTLIHMDPTQRVSLGENGRSFYNKELLFAIGVKRIISVLEQASGNNT